MVKLRRIYLKGDCIWPEIPHNRDKLKEWNRDNFGHVQKRIRILKSELEAIKYEMRTGESINKEAYIVSELDEWRLREELLWKQRSKVDWIKDGDCNTKFFHSKATQRKKRNSISKLNNDLGEWVT